MIYVAGPYFHKDPDIIELRMQKVYKYIADMMTISENGTHHCVTPMLMHSVVTKHQLPNDFNFWEDYSYDLLERCDEIHVLMLPGWEESRGVQMEIEYAKSFGIMIKYIPEV